MKNWFLFVAFSGLLGKVKAQNTIDITYIGNEGFLITDGTSKIIIDSIFTEEWGYYHYPLPKVILKQREATSPFDSIDVIQVTHNHADPASLNTFQNLNLEPFCGKVRIDALLYVSIL